MMLTIDKLPLFQVSEKTGFVPEDDPLDCLPDYYEPWEHIVGQMGDLLMSGRLRPFIKRLPHLTLERLDSPAARQRAMLLLSVMGNGYVWGGAEPAALLPAQIAVPWCQLADELGRPPIVAHESMVLNNWRRIDKAEPVTLDNVAVQAQFLGGMDEQWFYLVTLQIELDGAPAVPAMLAAQAAVQQNQPEEVTRQLQTIAQAIGVMLVTLNRMIDKCDPYIFYHRIRPFVNGWPDLGLIYEGVSPEPQMVIGGSAAQSALIQALDVGLGVEHTSARTRPFLQEMRDYMPRPHREFLVALEQAVAIRPFVTKYAAEQPQLADAYNQCIQLLDAFRQKHIEISVRYIIHQTPEGDQAKGTGGTSFVPFLSEARKETKRRKIGNSER